MTRTTNITKGLKELFESLPMDVIEFRTSFLVINKQRIDRDVTLETHCHDIVKGLLERLHVRDIKTVDALLAPF